MPDEPQTGVISPAGRAREAAGFAVCAAMDALRFFTRLAVPADWRVKDEARVFDGIAAAAPLAGMVLGAASGATLSAGLAIGLPDLAASVFAVAMGVLLSGALHLDGLADVADGFGGGGSRARKLAIMRDSRLGSFGAAALFLALAARIALVSALVERLGAAAAFSDLVAAAALTRPLAFVPCLALRPARRDGAGFSARPGLNAVVAGCLFGAAAAAAFGGPIGAAGAILLAAAALAGVVALARAQIGGYTGDVCGAAAEVAEIAALAGLVAAAGVYR